jgi:hypothetical protein
VIRLSAAIRLAGMSALAMCLSAPASADPVRITAGALTWGETHGSAPRITLAGEGFTFDGRGGTGFFAPFEQCVVPECLAGNMVDLHAIWVGADLPGTATFDDVTFPNVGSLASDASLQAIWSGSLGLPLDFEGGELTAPFHFTGLFFYPLSSIGLVQHLHLYGEGQTTLTFAPSRIVPGTFALSEARYEFSGDPVPEPTSMLLIGTGLAGLAALRRRHSRRQ